MRPSKLTKITAILSKRKHRTVVDSTTAIGSPATSFDSVMDLDGSNPCCACLQKKKAQVDETKHPSKHDAVPSVIKPDRVANETHCHSLGSGRFSPEMGITIAWEPPNHNTCDAEESIEVQAQLHQTSLNNPFLITVDGYSETERTLISSETLLSRLKLEDTDGIINNVQGQLMEVHDSNVYYGNIDKLSLLESGEAFYSFTCRAWMTEYEREMVKTMVNMSSFENETKDNYVPTLGIDDPTDVCKYTYVLQKAAYILPGVKLDEITPEVLSSNDYHECCQPVNGTKIWEHQDENTFRFTRPIIPHVYSMTIQFKVSQLHGKDIDALSSLFGIRVDRAILMERTKRSVPPKVDGTAKAKSILCYTVIPGGLLVTHATVILNTAIPTVVARVIGTFGRSGLAETCETAERTRQYFLDRRKGQYV